MAERLPFHWRVVISDVTMAIFEPDIASAPRVRPLAGYYSRTQLSAPWAYSIFIIQELSGDHAIYSNRRETARRADCKPPQPIAGPTVHRFPGSGPADFLLNLAAPSGCPRGPDGTNPARKEAETRSN